jgi:hypothetical protein
MLQQPLRLVGPLRTTLARWLYIAVALGATSGCASLIAGAASETISAAILNQSNPNLVADAAPAYLLLIAGLIHESPDDSDLLAAGAQLFAVYGVLFADRNGDGAELTAQARSYGERAICLAHEPACGWADMDYDTYVQALDSLSKRQVPELFGYAVGWLSHLRSTSDSWGTVADLPRVEAALNRLLALDETYQSGGVHVYLGTLNSLRPPALGGQPEVARSHFERAIELSDGKDLAAKVEFARSYGRLLYDRELHDRLLTEVIEAPVEADGFTLFNVLAKQEAEELLASADDYF